MVSVVVLLLLGLYWYFAAESFQTQTYNEDTDSAVANHLRLEKRLSERDVPAKVVSNKDNQSPPEQHVDHGEQKLPQQQKFPTAEFWILETDLGRLRIRLRPDLSPESVAYIQQVVRTNSCQACRFYRAEKPGIFQGIIKSETVSVPTVHGKCPDANDATKKDACHGPIMTRGMVGWAGGLLGPDFFIDSYEHPAEFWGTVHTGTYNSVMDVQ